MSNHRLLLIEDSIEIQDLLRFVFQANGFQVDVANDGLEALEKNLNDYDILLLDLQMPNMDGRSFLKVVRQTQGLTVPILMFTSHIKEGLHAELIEAGANNVITKPARGQKLITEVFRLIRESE